MKRKVFLLALLAVIAMVCFSSCYNPWWPGKDSSSPDAGYTPPPGRPAGPLPLQGDLKVTYKPNGADSGVAPTDPYSYLQGAPVTVLGNTAPSPLVKAGYEFAEWSDDPAYDTAGGSLSSGEQFTIEDHTELHAVWLEDDRIIKLNTRKKYTFPQKEYGYAPLTPVQMTLLNTEPGDTDFLTVRIGGRDPNKDYFDIYYTDPGNPMDSNQTIAPIGPNGTFSFWIVPKHGLPVGNYSITIRISNNPDDIANATQRCSFIAGFVVTPYPLTMEAGPLSYTNTTGSYLTPIASNTPAYTERTATFTVKVKGFKSAGDASGAGLAFSDPNGLAISYLDFNDQKSTAVTAIDAGAHYLNTKIFTVIVTFNDTMISGDPLKKIVIGTTGVSPNYYQNACAGTDVKIIDGQVDTAARLVPVNAVNITAFNAYANTNTANYNGLARHYKQTENITLPSVATGASNWTAIGSDSRRFTGSYDGGGKTITGLTINASTDWQGMFGYIENALVQNLGLVQAKIETTGGNSGGIAGWNSGSAVQYCYVKDSGIKSANVAGGIVGQKSYNGIVESCYAENTDVEANGTGTNEGRYVGGIVGYNRYIVKNCYSTGGTITGGAYYIGGIVGRNMGDNSAGGTPVVEYCYSTCAVVGNGAVGSIRAFVGGMVGQNYVNAGGTDKATARNLVALNPNVRSQAASEPTETGRILGENGANSSYSGTIGNNYARSDMTVNNSLRTSGTVTNRDGANITAADWLSATWWTGTVGFDGNVWNITNNSLPTLRNMPAGTQNPVAP